MYWIHALIILLSIISCLFLCPVLYILARETTLDLQCKVGYLTVDTAGPSQRHLWTQPEPFAQVTTLGSPECHCMILVENTTSTSTNGAALNRPVWWISSECPLGTTDWQLAITFSLLENKFSPSDPRQIEICSAGVVNLLVLVIFVRFTFFL